MGKRPPSLCGATDCHLRRVVTPHGDSVQHSLGDEFPGQVIGIAPQATTIGGDVVYPVTIRFDARPSGLRWGMSAQVEIQTGEQ